MNASKFREKYNATLWIHGFHMLLKSNKPWIQSTREVGGTKELHLY
jgi:hypothetical protein